MGTRWSKPHGTNIASSEIVKFPPAFFPGKNRRDPDGNFLENNLVVVRITPGQIIALSPIHEEKLRYFTKCVLHTLVEYPALLFVDFYVTFAKVHCIKMAKTLSLRDRLSCKKVTN